MSEIERLAKALRGCSVRFRDRAGIEYEAPPSAVVHAVLAAMRELSEGTREAMLDAAAQCEPESDATVTATWRAGIDHLLSSQ
jgi:hypothetical protein